MMSIPISLWRRITSWMAPDGEHRRVIEDTNSTENVEVGPTGPKGTGTDYGNSRRFFGGTE